MPDLEFWKAAAAVATVLWAVREYHATRRTREVEVLLHLMEKLEGGSLILTQDVLRAFDPQLQALIANERCACAPELCALKSCDRGEPPMGEETRRCARDGLIQLEMMFQNAPKETLKGQTLDKVRQDLALLEYGAALGLMRRMPRHIFETYFAATIVEMWPRIRVVMSLTRGAIGTDVYLQHCEAVVVLARRRGWELYAWRLVKSVRWTSAGWLLKRFRARSDAYAREIPTGQLPRFDERARTLVWRHVRGRLFPGQRPPETAAGSPRITTPPAA